MLNRSLLAAALLLLPGRLLIAQTIFVDPVNGKDAQTGDTSAPLATLDKAVAMANMLAEKGPVSIKLFPGLYVLTGKLVIQPSAGKSKGYRIEAVTLPDDTGWRPSKMPVIQSVSANNSEVQFPHSVGFLVAADDVQFRGLKFAGNANPAVQYYYPITKEDSLLGGLTVSQCYFSGDRYAAPIQGAVWAHGPRTTIDHCLFYNCKNALLFFRAVQGFSVTNTVIYGAYEAAMWVWLLNGPFVFRNNLIADCDYFWTIPPGSATRARFENSLFLNVTHDAANYRKGMIPASAPGFSFENVRRAGRPGVLSPASIPSRSGLPSIPEADEMGAGLFHVKR